MAGGGQQRSAAGELAERPRFDFSGGIRMICGQHDEGVRRGGENEDEWRGTLSVMSGARRA
ncbi:hypothetical protein E2C01_012227 [Portunus trituberculatus]|uniref:Uncharacterized protein n=1 Tax=Portunus trituberculatus TaxID=210409 RepID=A0A5B7DE20_PORTR|nr:hypothetical protein [Portunus trituberculatus]